MISSRGEGPLAPSLLVPSIVIVGLRTADGNCAKKMAGACWAWYFGLHGNHPVLLSLLWSALEHRRPVGGGGIDRLSQVRHSLCAAATSGRSWRRSAAGNLPVSPGPP